MIGQPRFYRWCDSQRLVNPAEVVVHVVQRNGVAVVLQLLTESIRQPREAPHGHAHRKVLALNKRCADVLRVGVAHHGFHVASVITLKPAIRYQFKTGQRDWPETGLFYRSAGCICKLRFPTWQWGLIFNSSGCVLWWESLCRGRALRSDPGPMTGGWLRRNR